MIYGRADERQPEVDADALGPVIYLDGDVSLVVIHGDYGVELAVYRLVEHGVGRDGAGGVYTALARQFDGGSYLGCLLVAYQPAIGCVWVERGDSDTRSVESPVAEAGVGQLYLSKNVVHGYVVAGDAKGAVGGQMHHAQVARHQHCGDVGGSRLALEYLHVPDVSVSGGGARLLVDGRCGDGGDLA